MWEGKREVGKRINKERGKQIEVIPGTCPDTVEHDCMTKTTLKVGNVARQRGKNMENDGEGGMGLPRADLAEGRLRAGGTEFTVSTSASRALCLKLRGLTSSLSLVKIHGFKASWVQA